MYIRMSLCIRMSLSIRMSLYIRKCRFAVVEDCIKHDCVYVNEPCRTLVHLNVCIHGSSP